LFCFEKEAPGRFIDIFAPGRTILADFRFSAFFSLLESLSFSRALLPFEADTALYPSFFALPGSLRSAFPVRAFYADLSKNVAAFLQRSALPFVGSAFTTLDDSSAFYDLSDFWRGPKVFPP